MPSCDRCGATFLGEFEAAESAAERYGIECPLCLLRSVPSSSDAAEELVPMARMALVFETTEEIRRRILHCVDTETPSDPVRTLRGGHLDTVARTLVSGDVQSDDRTNRERRERIADRVGIDATPSRSFHKDELVEILVTLLRERSHTAGRAEDE